MVLKIKISVHCLKADIAKTDTAVMTFFKQYTVQSETGIQALSR